MLTIYARHNLTDRLLLEFKTNYRDWQVGDVFPINGKDCVILDAVIADNNGTVWVDLDW